MCERLAWVGIGDGWERGRRVASRWARGCAEGSQGGRLVVVANSAVGQGLWCRRIPLDALPGHAPGPPHPSRAVLHPTGRAMHDNAKQARQELAVRARLLAPPENTKRTSHAALRQAVLLAVESHRTEPSRTSSGAQKCVTRRMSRERRDSWRLRLADHPTRPPWQPRHPSRVQRPGQWWRPRGPASWGAPHAT
jgi:hypothetical protein